MTTRIVAACLACVVASTVLADNQRLSSQMLIEANREEARLNSLSTFIHDTDLDGRLAAIVQRLTASDPDAAAIGFRVHALRSTAPYVFSLDNGAIYVSTGLLARIRNESQLAALVATELTPVVRADSARSAEIARERARQGAIPSILLVTITAGLAAFPLTKAESTAQQKLRDELRLRSDQLAMNWLQHAGYDVAEAPRAFRRLLDTLQAENRFGLSTLSSKSGLEQRILEVSRGLPDPLPAAPTSGSADVVAPLARRFSLELAKTDLDNAGSKSFPAVIERFDQEFGANGESSFLHAEYTRVGMTSDEQLPEAIRRYEICVGFPDAPAEALRELGFLYRKQGDAAKARQAFADYLQRMPAAADAPIVRSYMEKL